MCEFCVKHGEGKKWYLQARNYSADLLSDTRRRGFLKEFFSQSTDSTDPEQMRKLSRLPGFVQRMIRSGVTRRMKRDHFGQVLPLEDVESIFGFVTSITRLPCICRQFKLGREARYCYGIAVGSGGDALASIMQETDAGFGSGLKISELEQLDSAQALQAFAEHEKEGLCHTVWTFGTPFIGGLCNCDRADCMAMTSTVTHDIKVMFRAETVAETNPDLCTGCRSCMRVCQFGALAFSAANKKAVVDHTACYGCGVCRSACAKSAISLRPRSEVAAVADLW